MKKWNRKIKLGTGIFITSAFLGCATPRSSTDLPSFDYLTEATLWQQRSGEMRALYYQAYQLGERRLKEKLKQKSEKPKAVILDLDETVLDNSPYEAWVILHHASFPSGWKEWVALAHAEALPGSQDFLNFADRSGVSIFYISNRSESDRAGTIKNLKALHLPQVSDERVILAQPGGHGKEPARLKVAEKYNVVLLFGDNLNDFAQKFEHQNATRRQALVDQDKATFGDRFVILPNPMYGDWEGGVFEYQKGLTPEEMASLRRKALHSYDRP